jgi:hypothetical protein
VGPRAGLYAVVKRKIPSPCVPKSGMERDLRYAPIVEVLFLRICSNMVASSW